jgi:genome maintenance exonuclease 1
MFTHIDLNLPELKRESIDGIRYYTINGKNKKLVSITSVISHYNKEKFSKWREKVGEEEANRITKRVLILILSLKTIC